MEKKNKQKYGIILGIIAVITVAAGYFINELFPFFTKFIRIINRNQNMLWFYFLFLVISYSVIKLILAYVRIKSKGILFRDKKTDVEDVGQIEMLSIMLDQCHESNFSKIRLARYLSELILEVHAHLQRKSPEIIFKQLTDNILPVPENLREYMKASLLYQPSDVAVKKRRLFRRKNKQTSTVLDIAPETVVNYIENQLNIRKENGYQ